MKVSDIYKQIGDAYEKYALPILDDVFDGGEVEESCLDLDLLDTDITAEQAREIILQCNCVLISACRAVHKDTEAEDTRSNVENTTKLENELKSLGLPYLVVDGCYREKFEEEASHEVSFFVFQKPAYGSEFFAQMYETSVHYGQDSFLYIGNGQVFRAFEVATNDNKREEFLFQMVGKLKLNLPPVGPYTNLTGNDTDGERITFVVDEDEEIKDTTVTRV